jgi:hypothetical protein
MTATRQNLIACAALLAFACSDADPGDGIPDDVVPCPVGLEPIEAFGAIQIVGDGTAASCTEAALRDATAVVTAASGGGSVVFDCGAAPITITLTSPLVAGGVLLIDGSGSVTLSGGGSTRVIELENYAELTVQNLVIRDGLTEESGAGILHPWYGVLRAIDVRFENNVCTSQAGEIGGGAVFAGGLSEAVFSGCEFAGNSASNGGAILNRGSTLTIIDCAFEGNAATSSGEGQFGNGGALYIDGMNYDDPGDLFLCATSFTDNRATLHGSAVFSYFYEGSTSHIDRCVFAGNNFDGSPTGGAGGLYHETGPLTLSNSLFSANRSDLHAAGLFVGSGSSALVVNCTFAGNAVPEVGAAIFSGVSPLEIVNSTFFANYADYAPAIFNNNEASIGLRNTVLSGNTTPNQYSALACTEPLIDRGGNVQWPQAKPGGGDDVPCADGVLFADPLLRPLADNGGPTQTMALDPASPAVDHGVDCPPPETDQRGVARVGACDSGAFEIGE